MLNRCCNDLHLARRPMLARNAKSHLTSSLVGSTLGGCASDASSNVLGASAVSARKRYPTFGQPSALISNGRVGHERRTARRPKAADGDGMVGRASFPEQLTRAPATSLLGHGRGSCVECETLRQTKRALVRFSAVHEDHKRHSRQSLAACNTAQERLGSTSTRGLRLLLLHTHFGG